jgi:hypothetical protein
MHWQKRKYTLPTRVDFRTNGRWTLWNAGGSCRRKLAQNDVKKNTDLHVMDVCRTRREVCFNDPEVGVPFAAKAKSLLPQLASAGPVEAHRRMTETLAVDIAPGQGSAVLAPHVGPGMVEFHLVSAPDDWLHMRLGDAGDETHFPERTVVLAKCRP